MAQETCSLARFSLFKSLDEEAIRRFDERCLWRRFEPKMVIVEFDLESTEVYFVASGVVRVPLPSMRRTDVILADIGPGEFFGELSAIDGRPRSATVTAVTAAMVGYIPAATFREALRESADVCEQVLQLLTARIRLLDARIAEFSSLGVRDRIHAQLLRLARIRSTQPNEALISPPPVQAEFAARISTHREAVAREFKALERAGLLERRRGAVVIRDVRMLTTMLERASDRPF